MLSVEAARAKVIEVMGACVENLPTETIDIAAAPGASLKRILAENITADRNYPPFNRSIRDGYAVRAADVTEPGAKLRLVGESRAGVGYSEALGAGECVRILTGAPVPKGANAVMMQENAHVEGDSVIFNLAARPEQFFVHAGAEARIGETIMTRGARLSYAELRRGRGSGAHRKITKGVPAPARRDYCVGRRACGCRAAAGPFSDSQSRIVLRLRRRWRLLVGGEAVMLGIAPDKISELIALIKRGLECDWFWC